jgi:hypothetical protein
MKARQLIGGSAFPPDELKVIFEAFDDAWAEVAACWAERAATLLGLMRRSSLRASSPRRRSTSTCVLRRRALPRAG